MSAEWAELDEEAWRVFGGMHLLLLRLAGQVPDDLLTHVRTMLAVGDLAALPDAVSVAAVEFGVPLTAAEVELLRRVPVVLGIGGGEPVGVDQVTIGDAGPEVGHRFAPVPPHVLARAGTRIPAELDLTGAPPADLADLADELRDLTDDLVADALAEHGGVVAVWRTWRFGPQGPPDGARRVYLAEVEPGVRAWEVTLAAQRELLQMDEDSPQVEVYWTGDDLPPYHLAARAATTLLWTRR
ncbi:hypothetical protein [Streptosporangium sp. KLBMP 9127]|nr:hypothetical protein [Streptosporangium sp. KLBMP 9127]